MHKKTSFPESSTLLEKALHATFPKYGSWRQNQFIRQSFHFFFPKRANAHNPKKSTTDYTDGATNVTRPNPFHISPDLLESRDPCNPWLVILGFIAHYHCDHFKIFLAVVGYGM